MEVLREKIRDSEVNVEIDSQNSNLAEMLNKIRAQYDKLAKKNLKETDDWYQSKVRSGAWSQSTLFHPLFISSSSSFFLQFDNIKVEEAQNNEALNSGKADLKDLLKKKQSLEVEIQSLHSTVMHSYSRISPFTCWSDYSRGVSSNLFMKLSVRYHVRKDKNRPQDVSLPLH